MNDKGYPTLETAEKIWREGFDYRCATTEFKVRDEYVFHTTGVAETAQKIAAHTPDMNPEKAYILGLLHDYGKKYDERASGRFHARAGFEELNAMGYPAAAKICLTHSFPSRDFCDEDYASYPADWLEWAHRELAKVTYDDYDRLIQLCDMFFEGMQMVDFETRFSGIVRRYNLKPEDVENLRKNAERNLAYFEAKTGVGIYQLLNIKTL